MTIGIISDTHDDMEAIRAVVSLFTERGVSHVFHAGDITSPFTFDLFGTLRCGITAIFGNNDGDRLMLRDRSGGAVHPQPYMTTMDNRKIIMVHEPDLVAALSASAHFDLVVYGHTHVPEIRRNAGTVIINPGKLARLHKGRSTCAILNTETMEAELVSV